MRAATGFVEQGDEEGQTLLNEPLLTDEIHHTREALPQCPPGAVCEGGPVEVAAVPLSPSSHPS